MKECRVIQESDVNNSMFCEFDTYYNKFDHRGMISVCIDSGVVIIDVRGEVVFRCRPLRDNMIALEKYSCVIFILLGVVDSLKKQTKWKLFGWKLSKYMLVSDIQSACKFYHAERLKKGDVVSDGFLMRNKDAKSIISCIEKLIRALSISLINETNNSNEEE